MADVKKREAVPDLPALTALPDPEEVTITVGDKEYPLPTVTFGQYRKIAKDIDAFNVRREELGEVEILDFAQEFYYKLLRIDNPAIKKTDLDEMPYYQAGAEFFLSVRIALYKIPLH
jgi:hypothetical protein